MNKRELWLRLKNYHFDHMVPGSLWEHIQAQFGSRDASTKAFAHKLARKLGWSNSFALKAVHEYKKFVYLGVVSDFVVTPSQVIDQVWHQHILFSRAYRNFCQDVIRYEFDHTPELIAIDEQTGAFHAQYLDTLELYREEFGIDPPPDIWGAPKFDKKALPRATYRSKKKEQAAGGIDGGTYYSDEPLYQSFDPVTDGSFTGFLGFEDGDGGGAGASGSWGDSDGGSDASGDSGSCSSCSSGCGGGD